MTRRQRIRKSVPTLGVSRWWLCGWSYIMPDFDNHDHSIIEWLGEGTSIEPDDESEQLAVAVSHLTDELARL